MSKIQTWLPQFTWIDALIAAASLILAIHPVEWLITTWTDPAYDSKGIWVFAVITGLTFWSLTSPIAFSRPTGKPLAIGLLAITALFRLASQLLAVNILGALALVVDVYAIGLLLGLLHRKRAVSPGWLAMAFVFCLPLANLIQRTAGYLLQLASATGVAGLLKVLAFPDVRQEGIRILLAGKDILVDLPCSGTQSVLWLLLFFTVLMILCRPNRGDGLQGLVLTLVVAYLANTLRILMLAIGIAFPQAIGGIDVMAQPWHDAIGLFTLLVAGILPVLFWARMVRPQPIPKDPKPVWVFPVRLPARIKAVTAILFLTIAVVITQLPARPVDVSHSVSPVTLPMAINHEAGERIALSPQEEIYFTRYGGRAEKRRYGTDAVMVVQTGAPLRHLHNPSDCLRGMGFDVQYLGMASDILPSGVYRAMAPDGKTEWRVAVTFVSDTGVITTNVSEAIWHWLKNPGSQWMAVQRISPAGQPKIRYRQLDRAVAAALDLPVSADSFLVSRSTRQKGDPE